MEKDSCAQSLEFKLFSHSTRFCIHLLQMCFVSVVVAFGRSLLTPTSRHDQVWTNVMEVMFVQLGLFAVTGDEPLPAHLPCEYQSVGGFNIWVNRIFLSMGYPLLICPDTTKSRYCCWLPKCFFRVHRCKSQNHVALWTKEGSGCPLVLHVCSKASDCWRLNQD